MLLLLLHLLCLQPQLHLLPRNSALLMDARKGHTSNEKAREIAVTSRYFKNESRTSIVVNDTGCRKNFRNALLLILDLILSELGDVINTHDPRNTRGLGEEGSYTYSKLVMKISDCAHALIFKGCKDIHYQNDNKRTTETFMTTDGIHTVFLASDYSFP